MNKELIEKTIEKANVNCVKAGQSLTGLQEMYLVMAFEELPDVKDSVCEHKFVGEGRISQMCSKCGASV